MLLGGIKLIIMFSTKNPCKCARCSTVKETLPTIIIKRYKVYIYIYVCVCIYKRKKERKKGLIDFFFGEVPKNAGLILIHQRNECCII